MALNINEQQPMFITEVKCVSHPNPYAFEQRVNELMADGWMMKGEMMTTKDGFAIMMIQLDPQYTKVVTTLTRGALETLQEQFGI